ncbi:MAG: PIN domain-containing protein [Solirubrobacteraceae bacterium]
MTRAIADTSVFIARGAGRPLGELPDEIAVSVITVGELELGVLRARDGAHASRPSGDARAGSGRVSAPRSRRSGRLVLARIADEELCAGRKLRRHDAWIAATALRHAAAVVTQDEDFGSFASVRVIRV